MHPVRFGRDGHGRGGAHRHRHHPSGDVPHPVLHAGGHPRGDQVPQRRRLRRPRRRDRAGQHLPPDAAARRRCGRPLRRSRPLLGVGRADADRLRRLPGVLAQPEGRRRRRHVRQHLRRVQAPLHAGVGGRGAGTARRRHPDGPRRLPAAAERGPRHPPGSGSHECVGGAGPRGSPPGGSGAVRHRPGWHRRVAATGERRAHGGAGLRRLRHRRAAAWGRPGRRCSRRWPRRSSTSRPTGRAT